MNGFVADGSDRYDASIDYVARRAEFRRDAHEKYQGFLNEAGFFKRLLIHFRIQREIRAKMERIRPSPYSLW